MFHLVCLGWLFFRADNFPAAFAMLEAMVTRVHFDGAILARCSPEMCCSARFPRSRDPSDGERRLQRLAAPGLVQTLAYAYLARMLLFLHAVQAHEFIYFQF
jgi:hypothetical protein